MAGTPKPPNGPTKGSKRRLNPPTATMVRAGGRAMHDLRGAIASLALKAPEFADPAWAHATPSDPIGAFRATSPLLRWPLIPSVVPPGIADGTAGPREWRQHSGTVAKVVKDHFEPHEVFTEAAMEAYSEAVSTDKRNNSDHPGSPTSDLAALFPLLIPVAARCTGPDTVAEDYDALMRPRSDGGLFDTIWQALVILSKTMPEFLAWIWPTDDEIADFLRIIVRHVKELRIKEGMDNVDTRCEIEKLYNVDEATAALWQAQYGQALKAINTAEDGVAEAEKLAQIQDVGRKAIVWADGRLQLRSQELEAKIQGLGRSGDRDLAQSLVEVLRNVTGDGQGAPALGTGGGRGGLGGPGGLPPLLLPKLSAREGDDPSLDEWEDEDEDGDRDGD